MIIYTDGACSPSTRKGGWAFCVVGDADLSPFSRSGAVSDTTNNSMELHAILEALKYATQHYKTCEKDEFYEIPFLTFYTDSQLCIGWITQGWRIQHAHIGAYVSEIKDLIEAYPKDVSFHHVKGHAGNYYNEIVDRLANEAKETKESGSDSNS